jgi:hypothetical protein
MTTTTAERLRIARNRWARYTAECFANRFDEFATEDEYRRALDECLTNLAEAHGLELKDSGWGRLSGEVQAAPARTSGRSL